MSNFNIADIGATYKDRANFISLRNSLMGNVYPAPKHPFKVEEQPMNFPVAARPGHAPGSAE